MLKRPFLQTALISLLGLSLISCGGDSTTDRISNPPQRDLTEADIPEGQLGIKLPFFTENVDFEIYQHRTNTLIKRIENFSGADLITTIPANLSNDLLRIVLKPRSNAQVYDVIQNKLVAFNTPIHSISNVGLVFMSPLEEFSYQRALVLTGQFDIANADPSLIQTSDLDIARDEVNRALGYVFSSTFPSIWHETSLAQVTYDRNNANRTIYQMTYQSLGHLKRWSAAHQSNPSYSDFVRNIAVDLRDGYLDGKSFKGDSTNFIATVSTTRNTDPSKNNSFDYAQLQKTARDNYGNELKFGTLEVALSFGQAQLNPAGYAELTSYKYTPEPNIVNSTTQLRTNGAGDYTRAFGFTHSIYCSNSNYPCLQGLNADFSTGTYSDVEALTGIYKSNQCELSIAPFGQVKLSAGDRVYLSQINRDTTDHALRISSNPQRYILNVGSGESAVPFYIQLQIEQGEIKQATAGNSNQPYPSELDTKLASCSFT